MPLNQRHRGECGPGLSFRGLKASGAPLDGGWMLKVFCTEALQRMNSDLLEALGPEGLLDYRSPDAPHSGEIEHAFRHGGVTTIYGGSSEVLRSLIGQRGLGLPRG